jgi:nicotinate-nucleotide adenylyltransferase
LNAELKIGIYGGSFDPVHLGHLLVAQAAVEELSLDKIFFVPAAQSPFKTENKITPAEIRLRWLHLALAGKTSCEIDEQEIRRGGVSFTIETLRAYAQKFPAAKLFYLIGADNAAKLNEWREANELARLAEFVAVPRPGELPPVFPAPFRGRVLKGFPFGVSSSEIRERARKNLMIENLVPSAVAAAIRAEKIYV